MNVQTYLRRHPALKDSLGIAIFLLCVLIGTLFINAFIFRSFNVEGPSMQNTLFTGDRLIVDRIPVTIAQLGNKPYMPGRGQVIVFKNPQYDSIGQKEEYIVKRVIAFPGERVVLENGQYTVFNKEHPNGFDPDDATRGKDNSVGPQSPTSGRVDEVVPAGTLFVSGDHREDQFSYDSRNGLGTIPLYDVIGPVSLRIFPFNKIRTF